MAGIFDGMFGPKVPGSRTNQAGQNLQYGQELRDYDDEMEAFRQRQAMEAAKPQLEKVFAEMNPERAEMGRLAEIMMNNPATYDKGAELLNKVTGQRGAILQDQAGQDAKFNRFKEEVDYKIANPSALDRTTMAQDYELFESLGDDSGRYTQEQINFLNIKRKEQFIDLGTELKSTVSGETHKKQLARAEFEKKVGIDHATQYLDFPEIIDQTETFMAHMNRKRSDVQQLHGLTIDENVGWQAMFNWIPESDPQKWREVRNTVVANIGIDKLMEMKENSAQGASGLGALSDTEMKILTAIVGSLEQAQTPQQIKKVLARLDHEYARMQDSRTRKLKRTARRNKHIESKYGVDPLLQYELHDDQKHLLGLPGAEVPKVESPLPLETDADPANVDDLLEKYK